MFAVQSYAETWNIVVDDFPPYSCVRCPEGGAGVKALREALRSVDVEMVVTYLPFVHILKETKTQKYTGYFSWPSSVQSGYLMPSKALFASPLIFVERKENILEWQRLSDLKGKRIGLYEGSGYFEEFMDLVKKGIIIGVSYPSDSVRIRLVSQGRLDGALMDRNNAFFHIKELPKAVRNKVHVNESVLHLQATYLVIQEKQKDKLVKLEQALNNVDTQKIVDEYLKKNFSP